MGAQLVIIAGPDTGGVFPLSPGAPLLIGRGRDTATRLTDPRVSRVHCEVQFDGGRVVLKDRGSEVKPLDHFLSNGELNIYEVSKFFSLMRR